VIAHRGTDPKNWTYYAQTCRACCVISMFNKWNLPAHLHIGLSKCCEKLIKESGLISKCSSLGTFRGLVSANHHPHHWIP
jgi:hypothetical protein